MAATAVPETPEEAQAAQEQRGLWARLSAGVHTGLDVAGFIPGLGAVPDLANAGIHAVEGDLGMAGISAVAAVPGIGDGIKAGAMAAKAGKQVAEELAEKAAKEAAEKGTRKTGKDGVRVTGSRGKKAENSSKAERHGDSGWKSEKSKKQIEELEERKRNATSRREKKKLGRKIRNIEEAGQRAEKGGTHHRR